MKTWFPKLAFLSQIRNENLVFQSLFFFQMQRVPLHGGSGPIGGRIIFKESKELGAGESAWIACLVQTLLCSTQILIPARTYLRHHAVGGCTSY
jgi:hypothetical protein